MTAERKRADTEKRLARVSRFLREGARPGCRRTRLSPKALEPRIGRLDLAEVTALTLAEVLEWVTGVPAGLPAEMRQLAEGLVKTLVDMARRLVELGLGYLGLDRAGFTLSTGERQRVQLARALRNRTTGCSTSSTSRPSGCTTPTSTGWWACCRTWSPHGDGAGSRWLGRPGLLVRLRDDHPLTWRELRGRILRDDDFTFRTPTAAPSFEPLQAGNRA